MSHPPADFGLQPITGTLNSISDTAQAHIWDLLTTCSVEAILSGCRDLLEFAGDHCLYAAAVKSLKVGSESVEDAEAEEDVSEEKGVRPGWVTENAWRDTRVDGFWSSEKPASSRREERTPRTVGFTYLSPSPYPSSMNLGVTILPQYRKCGFGTEAVREVLKVAFTHFQCHRIQTQIGVSDRDERTRLTRLFTSLGFKHEGISRRCLLVPQPTTGDEWRDVTTLALLDTDFISLSDLPMLPVSYVKRQWDDLFSRHERERDSMLEVEVHADIRRQALRRTSSTETIKREDMYPEKAQTNTASELFEGGPSLTSPISAAPPQVAFGSDKQRSHNQVPNASSSTTNVDAGSILRQRRLFRTAEGSSVGSRQGDESPESSEAEYSDSYSLPPPGSPSSIASWDSDAESDWTSASRGSQSSESDWEMWEMDVSDAHLTAENSIRN